MNDRRCRVGCGLLSLVDSTMMLAHVDARSLIGLLSLSLSLSRKGWSGSLVFATDADK